jgi:hypothetical protein
VLQVAAGRVKLLRRKACNPDRGFLLLAVVVVAKEDGAKKLVEDNQDTVGGVARRNANLEDVVVACADGPVVSSHKDTIPLARFQ